MPIVEAAPGMNDDAYHSPAAKIRSEKIKSSVSDSSSRPLVMTAADLPRRPDRNKLRASTLRRVA
jgi:hypothetical protein